MAIPVASPFSAPILATVRSRSSPREPRVPTSAPQSTRLGPPGDSPPPLSARLRHGYGIGAFALAIGNTSVMFFLLKVLVDTAGLAPATAGTILLVGKLWDAVSDPLVGRWSDHTRHPMGARRSWIAVAALPFALTFAGLWLKLPFTGWALIAAYLGLYLTYNTAYTAVVVPYGALTPTLTTDREDVTRLNGARMGWSMVGGLTAALAMPILRDVSGAWTLPGLVLAVAMLPPLWWTVRATAGHDTHQPPAADAAPQPIWSSLAVLAVPGFRRVATAFVAGWSTLATVSALLPFYVQHHVGRADMLDAVLAALQLSALATIPVVVWLANRTSKRIAYMISMASFAALLLAMAALPAHQLELTLLLGVLAGLGVAAAHVLPWAMLPAVVEQDAQDHGTDRAGAFYGMMTFVEKTGTALALWIASLGLQLSGYQQGADTQTAEAMLGLRLTLGVAPALALCLAVAYVWRWPTTQAPGAA